ncbi:MAG: exopolyphosphatase / guanosine-5'-triphosphate 3'-diphosphate pyrophosphatase, partial [bacterium]
GSHHLTKEKMEQAFATITRYVSFARAREAEHILITATSAVREATNKDYFLARVKELTDVTVETLSGIEEARLIALAVTSAMNLNGRRALIIDIGGGSTEFIITDGSKPSFLNSMRLGAVRLAEAYKLSDPVKKKELIQLRKYLFSALAHTAQEVQNIGYDIVIGTSGTILNLVNLAAQSREDSASPEKGFNPFSQQCSVTELKEVNDKLAKITEKERTRFPGLDPKRADIIVAGGQLLEAILTAVGTKEIITCDWSLREGVLLNFVEQLGHNFHVDLGEISLDEKALDIKGKTILSIARRYEYQPTHAHQVAKLAGMVFDKLHCWHSLTQDDRVLLQYAAILHDIGYHISHVGHHKHAYYLIQHSEIPGFSTKEIAIIANVVRFHRGTKPSRQACFRRLNKIDRTRVEQMSALLRLADGLDRTHRSLVEDLQIEIQGKALQINVVAKEGGELEIWYTNQNLSYFEEVFHKKISINLIADLSLAKAF